MMREYTLAASAARTASASEAAVHVGGLWRRAELVFDVTASATDAGDTLDVYVDISPDSGTTWVNAVHFAQQAGNGAAKTEIAILDPSNPGVATINVTADAAAGAVRPSVIGRTFRARSVLVDGGGANTSHTFSVKAYIQ